MVDRINCLCGKEGQIDVGEHEGNRYPCLDCYKEMEKRWLRAGEKIKEGRDAESENSTAK